MARIQLTREAAERIVRVGTRRVYSTVQEVPKPARSGAARTLAGHRICTTSTKITGPNQATEVTIEGETVEVKCPLLRSAEEIASGTKVVVSWNSGDGCWQIIEAQCPAS